MSLLPIRARITVSCLVVAIAVVGFVAHDRSWLSHATNGAAAPAGSAAPEASGLPTAPSVEPSSTAPAPSNGAQASAPSNPAPSPEDVQEANAVLQQAAALAASRGTRSATAVYDRASGQLYTAGDVTGQFQSASVVKTFIAAELIWTGQMADPSVAATALEMIKESDDDAADSLYGRVGRDNLVNEIAARTGVTGLAPPPVAGSWGSTYITATAMVSFYKAVAADPQVGPWLLNAMAQTTEYAADGTDQYFGIAAATTGWQIKQGWVCCEDGVAGVNSTGFIDNQRYIVVILTEAGPSMYLDGLTDTIDAMADALLPGGEFPG